MTRLLNGKPVAEAINERSLTLIEMLNEKDITPTLAIFRIGEDASDLSYEKSAIKNFFCSPQVYRQVEAEAVRRTHILVRFAAGRTIFS